MQQRQLRLGDILDDYCPRERRLTNHAVVAMVGPDVKQTRCTTCDAEHEYKHAKVPRQRKKSEAAGLHSQVLAAAPKRVAAGPAAAVAAREQPGQLEHSDEPVDRRENVERAERIEPEPAFASAKGEPELIEAAAPAIPVVAANEENEEEEEDRAVPVEEGPVHRPLIRATLPRPEGQVPPARPAPEFTIRQPGGRPGRFRPRHQRGAQSAMGSRSNGNTGGSIRGARAGGGRPPQGAHGSMSARPARRQGGRKRSK